MTRAVGSVSLGWTGVAWVRVWHLDGCRAEGMDPGRVPTQSSPNFLLQLLDTSRPSVQIKHRHKKTA